MLLRDVILSFSYNVKVISLKDHLVYKQLYRVYFLKAV